MAAKRHRFQAPEFDQRVIAIVGGFGSGKSEVALNLARQLAASEGLPVSIADLDVINPYFRAREAAAELAALGIKSLVPPGSLTHADLPIIVPEIKGAIQQSTCRLILDVGGDSTGARILRSLGDAFKPGGYDLLLVLNASRPFTADVEGTLTTINQIETASGLQFTGIISNTHLLEDTTVETVYEGLNLSRRVARKTGLPVRFVSVLADIVEALDPSEIDAPLLALNRSLLKPWERRKSAGSNIL